jgi:hypothetical protein
VVVVAVDGVILGLDLAIEDVKLVLVVRLGLVIVCFVATFYPVQ